MLDVLANDDGEVDPSTLRVLVQPQHGEASPLPDGTIELTTQPGFAGEDELVYEVCDVDGACSEATVRLTITRG